jgi:LDH2 family malate/lactate/ureidoglycolate dehydrogenase
MSFALETPVVVSPEGKRKLVVDVLSRLGASHPECSIQAHVLTEGDLCGHHSHGLQRLPGLASCIKKGLVRANINPAHPGTIAAFKRTC